MSTSRQAQDQEELQILKMKRQLAAPELQISEKKPKMANEHLETMQADERAPLGDSYNEIAKLAKGKAMQQPYGKRSMVKLAEYSKTINPSQKGKPSQKGIQIRENPVERKPFDICAGGRPRHPITKQLLNLRPPSLEEKQKAIVQELTDHTHQVHLKPQTPDKPDQPEKANDLNPKMIRRWKPSNLRPVTPDQLQILDQIFNHIRQGTKSQAPVRDAESEFCRLNKLLTGALAIEEKKIKYNNQFESSEYLEETSSNIKDIHEDIPCKWRVFEEVICPNFFHQLHRWNRIWESLQQCSWEYTLKTCFSKSDVAAFADKATVWPSSPGKNQVVISREIDKYIFQELFDGGFIYGIFITEHAGRMVSLVPSLQEFVEFLLATRTNWDEIDCTYGLRIFSAPPLFSYQTWHTVGEFIANKPKVYPSIHVIQKVKGLDEDMIFVAKPVDERLQVNDHERAVRLQQVEDAAYIDEEHYVWKDDKRILYHALDMQRRIQLVSEFCLHQAAAGGIFGPQMHIKEEIRLSSETDPLAEPNPDDMARYRNESLALQQAIQLASQKATDASPAVTQASGCSSHSK